MSKRILLYILSMTVLTSCFESELEFSDQFEPVVEAYVYQGKDLSKVNLTSMISFDSDSSGGDPISSALVYLDIHDELFSLPHNDSIPGIYSLESTPALSAGDSLHLEIVLDGEYITASTVIPPDPPEVNMSASTIYITKVTDPMEFRSVEMPDPVELTWENPDARYYFLDIQNIESSPVSIRPDVPDGHPGGGKFAFQMITQPTNDQFYAIEPMFLEYYGTHRIVFTSVNDEYAYLYNSLNQDTRELNEPYSNIENGLGIFTAFNADTLYLEVVPIYN